MEPAEFVESTAASFDIPGVAAGILVDGQEIYASHGVTRLDRPTPVDEKTLFHIASVTKTFTATALMRLAAEGKVDLDAPVRRYVPSLRLASEEAAAQVTVLNLLNHTAGLDWNLIRDDGSLEGFVAKLADLDLIAPVGARASYSQAGYNLAGLVIEKVTGLPYEKAVASLVLEPSGLTDTVFDLDDVVLRPFTLGHNRAEDGTLRAARPWKANPAGSRSNNPGGGSASNVRDLLRWARFHLGTGEGVLPAEALRQMTTPTVELRGSTLGDAFGICWFLREVGGVQTIGHGGSGNGQYADLLIVPSRGFAVVSLSNAGPEGYHCNQAILEWALEHYLGLTAPTPDPLPYDDTRAREVAGRYEIDAMNLDIATDGTRLTLAVEIKPELRRSSDTEMPPDLPPAPMAFLPGDNDDYILTEGPLQGQRGFFTRNPTGQITAIDLAGRLFPRTTP